MPTSKVSTVTEERKHELLMEARHARLSWVQSSTPYKHTDSPITETAPPKSSSDAISILESTPVSQHLPSSIQILNALFDGKPPDEVEELTKTWRQKIQTRQNKLQSEKLVGELDDHAFVFCYQEILERLCMPESTDIVQGMRHFVRSFHDLFENDASALGQGAGGAGIDNMISSIHKYLASVYSSIASHHSWGGDNTSETKMMLETFIYSKCHEVIMKALRNSDVFTLDKDELEFGERLVFLQFVNPSHLEIPYFCSLPSKRDGLWKDVLSKPIMLLQSLDNMYSPAQMLRCILEVYRGVNDALKLVIAGSDGAGRMPSADDCLPTIILCMICAKPRILTNLKFLEVFATNEQMRGEAGYAFTNLFSATQFIRELDLDMDGEAGSSRPSLHIAPEELKQKLTDFKTKMRGDVNFSCDHKNDPVIESEIKQIPAHANMNVYPPITVPVHVVTAARLSGDDPSDWALKWLTSNTSSMDLRLDSSLLSTESGEGTEQAAGKTTRANAPPFPEGFTRSYKFLATEPNDIRISDIPALLDEYKLLVRTTEILLMERNMMERNTILNQMKNKKEILDQSLAEAEASTIEEENTTTVTK